MKANIKALNKRAKQLLKTYSYAYAESTMWAERDEATGMRHITSALKRAAKSN